MKSILLASFVSCLLFTSCDVFLNENVQINDGFFEALVNGEAFSGVPDARLRLSDDNERLSFGATQGDGPTSEYRSNFSFASDFILNQESYPVEWRIDEQTTLVTGMLFFEGLSDVIVTINRGTASPMNRLTVRFDSTDAEQIFLEGEFEGLFIVDSRALTQISHTHRRHQDTLRVTNGRFRIPLEDVRGEEPGPISIGRDRR